jgi:hypothetical protein
MTDQFDSRKEGETETDRRIEMSSPVSGKNYVFDQSQKPNEAPPQTDEHVSELSGVMRFRSEAEPRCFRFS